MDWNSAITKKYIKEAEAVGLTLIGKGKNHFYRLYKCKKCGHKQEKGIYRVRNGRIQCKACFRLRITKEAKTKGLALLGVSKQPPYYVYEFIECGHLVKHVPANVRVSGTPVCQVCLEKKLKKEIQELKMPKRIDPKRTKYKISS